MVQLINKIKSAIVTLNTVEVKGKDNMNHQLAVILLLESVVKDLETYDERKDEQ